MIFYQQQACLISNAAMEVKKLDLPEVQFPELWSYDSEKKKISLVGKMRTRHRTRMQVFYTPLFTGCMDLIGG